jgi:regulator of protease activity HflC (stomatin/prohibitin superfamily)
MATVLLALYVSAEFILRLPEGMHLSRRAVMWYLADQLLGRGKEAITIDEGEVKSGPKPLDVGIGTGMVVVKPGNAAILQSTTEGGNDRVIGPGSVPLQPYERVVEVVSLREQTHEFPRLQMLTRDQIPLSFWASFAFQVAKKQDVDELADVVRLGAAISGPYQVYHQTIRDVAFKAPAHPWEEAVKSAFVVALRNQVARIGLHNLLDWRKPLYLDQLGSDVRDELAKEAIKWGVVIRRATILGVRMPPDVRTRMLDVWVKAREADLLRIGMFTETRVLDKWAEKVQEILEHETTTRSDSIKKVIEMLNSAGIDTNSGAVATKLVEYVTRENYVRTLPSMRNQAKVVDEKQAPPGKKDAVAGGDAEQAAAVQVRSAEDPEVIWADWDQGEQG